MSPPKTEICSIFLCPNIKSTIVSSYQVPYNNLYLTQFIFLLASTLAILWLFSGVIKNLTDGNGLHLQVVIILLGASLLVMPAFVIIKLVTTKFGVEIGENEIVSHVSGWAKVSFTWDAIAEVKVVYVENDIKAVKIVRKENRNSKRETGIPRKPFFRIRGDLIWCQMLRTDAVTLVDEIQKRLR